jgi:lysophospholipase L1-like esterase
MTLPNGGSHGEEEGEEAFPLSSTGWFFLSAVDMRMPVNTSLVVCLGDSITDGTASTLNGDDRWPDVLARRFARVEANRVAVVNAGIGSNQITGPETYSPQAPFNGGPAAVDRIDRDVVGLSGVTTVIWFEGINDLSRGASVQEVMDGLKKGVARMRAAIPGVRLIGATITPAVGSHAKGGTPEADEKRKAINEAIRSGGLFDDYVDFDHAVVNPQTGSLQPEFVPNSTIGGAGDNLHPNRAGYLAMGNSIRLDAVLPSLAKARGK